MITCMCGRKRCQKEWQEWDGVNWLTRALHRRLCLLSRVGGNRAWLVCAGERE